EDRLDPTTRRDLLRRIATKAETLADLVAELLDLTRFEGGVISVRREPTAIRDLAARISQQLDADGRVSVQVDDVTVEVDPMMLGRILTNLVNNALKHAGPDAHVWISGGHVGGGLEIRVEDDGDGVPHPQREHLFDAFHRSTSEGGTGFGLAAVARFARLHGGNVSVSDRPGGGASFRVWLPASDGSAASGDARAAVGEGEQPRAL
ncbi:MAG: ATP-binding protein, partial [Nitriliruptorales bacterium]|nr:ATP-binding protein [Nitriliruptorales bacterium]